MKTISNLFTNYVLICALTGWFSAQFLKAVFVYFRTNKFEPERLIGSGGMPSSHSAMVCAMTIAIARVEPKGMNSPVFAVAFIFACVVMYDAMGVRRSAGEQAKAINKVFDSMEIDNENDDEFETEDIQEVKVRLGHTPLEVLGGALLGILITIFYSFFY